MGGMNRAILAPTGPAPPLSPPPSGGVAAGARADVLVLAKRGSPWDFAPVAERWLDANPTDAEVALYLASAYLRLGLKTAAGEVAARLPAQMPRLGELVRAIAALGPDEVTCEERVARARAGVERLAARGCEVGALRAAFEAWSAAGASEAWFRTRDGNIVRRGAGASGAGSGEGGGRGAWVRFADERRAAQAAVAVAAGGGPSVGGGGGGASVGRAVGKVPPVYVDGFDPPWVVEALLAARPAQADGYVPRVVVCESDSRACLDALALIDPGVLEHAGLEVFAGEGAADRLEVAVRARLDTDLGERCVETSAARAREGALRGVLARLGAEQAARVRDDVAATAALYAGRDRAWWAARYAGAGFRPRVLIPTTRYSTFIRHSSGDIAAALEGAGCAVRVLAEPDASSCLSTAGYARAVREFEPDLVLLINYPRVLAGGAIPANVPFVCWVQDAMPHLFDAKVGRSQGPLDFLVGHLHHTFFTEFEYPRGGGEGGARTLALPVLASGRKFAAPASVDGSGAGGGGKADPRFECEVACVTHHSETPEQFVARMLAEAGQPGAAAVVEHLAASMAALADDLMGETLASRVLVATREALRRAGLAADDARVTGVSMSIAWPLLDRMLRHQTLGWAAAIARRRGWRFHLYGRGWAKHPTFADHDRGELPHGDALRAAYAGARAHLHVSPHTNLHQRVMECALSGGLALCRLTPDAVCQLAGYAASCLAEVGAEAERPAGAPVPYASAADHWSGMALVALLQRLGLSGVGAARVHVAEFAMPPGLVPMTDARRREPWAWNGGVPQPAGVAWLLGDLSESTFWSEATLEARLERAVGDERWRADLAGGIRGRVARELTYESAAERIITLVRDGLAGEPNAGCGAGAKTNKGEAAAAASS